MKQKSPLAAIAFITLSSALFIPGRLYGFVELFCFSLPPSNPRGALVQGSDGSFYGTTASTVFKMTPAGTSTTLVSFSPANGGRPNGLVQGNDGNFYGTTFGGGTSGYGTVFRITAGALTTLYSFTNGTDGYYPNSLVQGSDDNFYGTTPVGGAHGVGTVFKMTPSGVLTTLVSFSGTNGAGPRVGLVQGSDGNFYGTCSNGGSQGGGNIFRIDSLQTPPPVTATMSKNQIIVSWPEDYPGFTLQTATNLIPPFNWLDATHSPVLLNGQFTVTNSLSGEKFYRLRY